MKRSLFSLSVLLPAALLCSCGDDVTNVTNETGIRTVASLEEAGSCAAGDLVVTLDDAALFVCGKDGKWNAAKGEKGDSGAPGENGPAGDSGAVGAPGDKGVGGDSGSAGSACSGRTVKNVGVEISCGGEVVDTLRVGKAVCGTVPYNAATHLCDSRDLKLYKWVRIGALRWMAENLNFGEMVPGTERDDAQGNATAKSAQKYCWNDSAKYCDEEGGLYQWHTAMALPAVYDGKTAGELVRKPHRGICPSGWRIPDSADWAGLKLWADSANGGADRDEGRSLKSAAGWSGDPGSGSDDWGFNALPAGYRSGVGGFSNRGLYGHWWTTDERGTDSASRWGLRGDRNNLHPSDLGRSYGHSVRCVQDE